jgi:hypothetical protein
MPITLSRNEHSAARSAVGGAARLGGAWGGAAGTVRAWIDEHVDLFA